MHEMSGGWILLVGVIAACAHRAPAPPAEGVSPTETVSPPVTLEEFRAAFPVGTTILMRFFGVAPVMEERWTWTAADDEGCTIAALSCDGEGRVVSDEGETRTTWVELMSHAVFPTDRTIRTDASVDVAAGHFDTWLYTVRDDAPDGSPEVAYYHFDRTLPGPPVLMIIEQGGEEVRRMELVDRNVNPPAPGSGCML